MKEEWKWVNGFEGLYQISNTGKLKSFRKDSSGHIMSNKDKNGWYFTVNLSDERNKCHTTRIHTLVAKHFIGEIPKGYHVHHIDGNKQNNVVTNLKIMHPSEHRKETAKMLPQIDTGMIHYNQYERPKTIYMYDTNGNYLASFPNAMAASIITGICSRNILQVANKNEYKPGRVRKTAGGFVWKFESEVV